MKTADLNRFLAKVRLDDGAGCWEWTAATDPNGYGQFSLDSRARPAHRVAYEQFIGPIPAGLQLDHLCRVRHCVNPWHLEPVAPRENVLRGVAGTLARQRQLAKTHCPSGHVYDETNTYATREGWRSCRACTRAAHRRYAAERRSPL